MNIVFLDTKTMGDISNLNILDEFGSVSCYETTSPAQTGERIREADIVITNKVMLDREIIERADRLKLICVAATGTNNVDLEAAAQRDIPVKNVVGYAAKSVAQTTFALLLHFLHDIPYYDHYVKNGDYSRDDIFTHFGRRFWELSGKQFGIIGLGSIGRQVARIAEAFGAEVVYHSASGRNTDGRPYRHVSLRDLLSESDVISVHAPLNEHSGNLIDYEGLRLMKKSAILLNTGRGGIVNETDLARALDNGLLAGACIDVFTKEPLPEDHPYLKIKNRDRILLTPHMTWSSIEARTLLMDEVAKNIREFLKG